MKASVFKNIFLGLMLAVTIFPIIILADDPAPLPGLGYIPLAPIPISQATDGSGRLSYFKESTNVIQLIQGIVKITIGLCAALAVLMMVLSGVQYVMATDELASKKEAKERITSSLWGLLLAISSYVILNTINPDLVNFNDKVFSSVTQQPK